MKARIHLLCSVGLALAGASASGQILFSDNFDSYSSPVTVTSSGTANGYKIQFDGASGPQDFTAIFGFDYSGVTYPLSVPSAPRSSGGTTRGLYLTVNKDATGAAAAVNLYPLGQSFSGNLSLKFDVWINWYNLSTSTEHTLVGINHSGDVANRVSKAGSDGLFFAMNGDGGSSATSSTVRDFSVFQGQGAGAPALKTTGFGPATPLGSTFDNANAGFTGLFPSKDVPGYPTTPAGSPGLGWVTGEVDQEGSLISWYLNGTLVAQYTNTTAYTSGDIMVGYNDVFASIGDPNDYVIFDNIVVAVIPEPSVCALAGIGASMLALYTARRRKG